MPRRGPVAAAIRRRAEVRTALQHLSGNGDLRDARVIAVLQRAADRVLGSAAGVYGDLIRRRGPPVAGPLPNVADHVGKAVAVRRIVADRRGAKRLAGPRRAPREVA